MKYLITEAQKYRLYRLAELMDDVAAMDGLNELKPIEPLSDGAIMKTWESSDDWIFGFASAIEAAHGIGK